MLRDGLWQALSTDNDLAMSNAEVLGHTFIYLTPEEIATWTETLEPAEEEWLELNPDSGSEVLEVVKELIAEYTAE